VKFFEQIFEKYKNIKFRENPSSGSRVAPCGRTGGQRSMTKLTFASPNFVKVPEKRAEYIKPFISIPLP
jgi:hypothetical protein